jgi:hypothetical protein
VRLQKNLDINISIMGNALKLASARPVDTAAVSRTVGNLGGLWKNVAYRALMREDGRCYARADLKPGWMIFSGLVCSYISF